MIEETVEGVIESIKFENDDNGYKVISVETSDDEVTACGIMPLVYEGESVTLIGHWEEHSVYGPQFSVTSFNRSLPQKKEDFCIFLSSGIFKGVGKATAKLITSIYGDSTADMILNDPSCLERLKGINHQKAVDISNTFRQYYLMSETVIFLNNFGIGTGIAEKVYNKYGSGSVDKIKSDPYALIEDIPEIGFKAADKIASSIGYPGDSIQRISSAICYILTRAISNGHTYLPFNILSAEVEELIAVRNQNVFDTVGIMTENKKLKTVNDKKETYVYLDYMFKCESYVATRLLEMNKKSRMIDNRSFETSIVQFEAFKGFKLDDIQKEAIRKSSESGFCIITGGPGTGKTTIIRVLTHLFMQEKKKYVLCAPTGRAAKRMSEACGIEAKTIHRLLEFAYKGEEKSEIFNKLDFGRNENNPIEADVIIADEASMIDILLMYHLLKAVPDDCTLILVGDKDQLPSVGPGKVLRDLIRSQCFHTVILEELYRQESESLIPLNAKKINMGQKPILNAADKDFFMMKRYGEKDCLDLVTDLCASRLPKKYNIDPMKDIQVIIPNKKGVIGVYNLNSELQKKLNPESSEVNEKVTDTVTFREGDRVMQIKNNYEIEWSKDGQAPGKGIFNGEMGYILKIDDKGGCIYVRFDDDRIAEYGYTLLNQLEHCYAITVHKSQGSEFDYCIIPVLNCPRVLLTRNLLYTAITRAKKMVILVGDDRSIVSMITNNSEQLRYTRLFEQLNEASSK